MTENSTESGGHKADPQAAFKAMPNVEKLLLLAALAAFVGFLLTEELQWRQFFKFKDMGWFVTFSIIGSIGVAALSGASLFGVKLMDSKLHVKVLVLLAVLPALGFVIAQLHDFWYALTLAGAGVMGYAGAKITTRENIITKSE